MHINSDATDDKTMLLFDSVSKKVAIKETLDIHGDLSLNGKLFSNGNVALNNELYVKGKSVLDNTLHLSGDALLGGNLIVTGATELNGNTKAPTAVTSDNSTKLATTAFVKNQEYATLLSPNLAGYPTAPTPALGSSTTQIATTEYVRNEVISFVNTLPNVFDAINNLSASLANADVEFATSIAVSIDEKAPKESPTFSGLVTMPSTIITEGLTAYADATFNTNVTVLGDINANGQLYTNTPENEDNSMRVATTAFVKNQGYAQLAGAAFTGDISILGNSSIGNDMTVVGNAAFGNNINVAGNVITATLNITGKGYAVTPVTDDNTTQIATTAYVKNQGYAQLAGAAFSGNVSTAGHFNAYGDVDVSGVLHVKNKAVITEDASLNKNLYVGGAIYENGESLIGKYATLASPAFTGIVSGITQSMVGLGNVDNTSDINKPISTATQNELDLKANLYNPVIYGNLSATQSISTLHANIITGDIGNLHVINDAIIYGNLYTISDVSLCGNSYAKTMDVADNSTRIATTEFVQNQEYAKLNGANFTGAVSVDNFLTVSGDVSLNHHLYVGGNTTMDGVVIMTNDVSMSGNVYAKTLEITDSTDRVATTAYVQNQAYATIESPSFTGIPVAPTAVLGTSTTQIATTEYVRTEVASFVNALPDTLAVLNLLSQALSTSDASFASSLATSLSKKADLISPTFSGNVSMPVADITQTLSVSGNTTLYKNVRIVGDLSLGGNLTIEYKPNTVPANAIIDLPGRNGIFDNDISMNYHLYVGSDVSFNNNMHVGKDSSLGGVLSVMGDTTLHRGLYVGGNTVVHALGVNSKLAVTEDTSLNANVSVGGDIILKGKLNCSSAIYENGTPIALTYAPIQSPTFKDIATFDMVTTKSGFSTDGNAAITGELMVSKMTTLQANLSVGGAISENGVSLIQKYATLASPTFTGTVYGITKSMVALSEVDNTSDLDKPVSTAHQTALNLKSDIESPVFTGIPQAPTASTGANTNQIATTSFVQTELSNLVSSAPSTLNTLQELAAAINTDASFASTVAASIGLKAPIESPSFTGNVYLPTTFISNKLSVVEDVSLNSRVQVGGNLSVDGFFTAHFPSKSIPSSAIDDIANQYGKFMFQTQRNDVVTFDDEFFATYESAGNIPFIETLYATNSDLSLNGNIYIHGQGVSIFDTDLSCNKGLRVNGDIYEGGVLLSDKFVSQTAPIFTSSITIPSLTVTMDASVNANLHVTDTIFENGASLSSTYSKLVSPTFTGTVLFTGDVSANSNLHVANTIFENGVSLTSRYSKIASPIFTGIVSVPTLLATGDVSMNMKLKVGGEALFNDTLDISGAIIAHDNINIYGVINQYTLSLEDGNKVSFDTASQISALQSEVSLLKQQLTGVLQLLASHNIV